MLLDTDELNRSSYPTSSQSFVLLFSLSLLSLSWLSRMLSRGTLLSLLLCFNPSPFSPFKSNVTLRCRERALGDLGVARSADVRVWF
jgi:hypothetical protein